MKPALSSSQMLNKTTTFLVKRESKSPAAIQMSVWPQGFFCFFDESNCVNDIYRWANRMDNLIMDNLSPDYFKLAKF